jgi:DNA-binding IclR family transcriptional regulator
MAEGSKTVDQALRLLVELREGGPGTVAELGRRVGVSRSAAGRLLTSLEAHRFARRTDAGFDLGFDLLQFSAGLAAGIRAAAVPALRDLSRRFGETAALALRDGSEAVALEQVVPPGRVVNIQYRPGTRHPLSTGAHGLAILADANADPDRLDPELLPRLADIARTGYAVSHDELEPGVTGVAAPIVNAAGTPIGSVGVVAPSSRFPDVGAVAGAVIAAARTIAADLRAG